MLQWPSRPLLSRASSPAERSTSDHSAAMPSSLDGHGIFAIIVFAAVSLICIQPLRIPLPHLVPRMANSMQSKLFGGQGKEERLHGLRPAPSFSDQIAAARQPGQAPSVPSSQKETREPDTRSTPPATPAQASAAAPKRSYLTLNHVWTPALGILLLLATTTIGGEQVRAGIVGEEGVEPYDVLALFISLAYIAISLDATGLLRYLAFLVCTKAGSKGFRLYLLLYFFFWTAGVLVGNDPVILSGTAFLVYFTRVAGIAPPSAWIWSQFVAANISSAVLVSSNPTNLVIATGFGIDFPTYTAYMVLPALASALAALGAMLLFFRNKPGKAVAKTERASPADSSALSRGGVSAVVGWANFLTRRRNKSSFKADLAPPEQSAENGMQEETQSAERSPPIFYIPPSIIAPDVDARAALVDRNGAVFNTIIMTATLGTLVGTSVAGGVHVYMVAVPGAVVCFLRDLAYDFFTSRKLRKAKEATHATAASSENGIEMTAVSRPEPARTADSIAPQDGTINVGALGGTFAASLAGLLWRQGLQQGGVHVTQKQFALWCAVVIVPATVAGVAVILAETTHFTVGD
ncbi:TRANSPORTER ARSB-RELATED [Ceraceosorus bombacis]|uniref:TRANSPORTER ARSB-RELATED n=1 Tax=Ceraceosorus bombacis TaxID=401625 RepID=A0A0P1BF26_9BASI|nr:TRANSPORTER ARSB-RELATED [Ceraceosorus bombacis]